MPVSRVEISHFTDRSVSLRRIFLSQNQITNQFNSFCSVALRGLPLPACESVDCAGVS